MLTIFSSLLTLQGLSGNTDNHCDPLCRMSAVPLPDHIHISLWIKYVFWSHSGLWAASDRRIRKVSGYAKGYLFTRFDAVEPPAKMVWSVGRVSVIQMKLNDSLAKTGLIYRLPTLIIIELFLLATIYDAWFHYV